MRVDVQTQTKGEVRNELLINHRTGCIYLRNGSQYTFIGHTKDEKEYQDEIGFHCDHLSYDELVLFNGIVSLSNN